MGRVTRPAPFLLLRSLSLFHVKLLLVAAALSAAVPKSGVCRSAALILILLAGLLLGLLLSLHRSLNLYLDR